jgi:myosin heavy chain 6/7
MTSPTVKSKESKKSYYTDPWRSKYETEGLGRIDELETSQAKLKARLTEAEETIEHLSQGPKL